MTASPDVRNFSQIKVGDTVSVQYCKAIAAQVRPKGTGSNAQHAVTGAYVAQPRGSPATAVGQTIVETVKIQGVDTAANTVICQRQDGSMHTTTVVSPEGQGFIKGLHRETTWMWCIPKRSPSRSFPITRSTF
jgi:hypothetical protein